MLFNTKENTYHPILYFESPFPSSDGSEKIIRYKSKGHRTVGFTNREDAVNSTTELAARLSGYHVNKELDEEGDLMWDGIEMPTDIQLRSR